MGVFDFSLTGKQPSTPLSITSTAGNTPSPKELSLWEEKVCAWRNKFTDNPILLKLLNGEWINQLYDDLNTDLMPNIKRNSKLRRNGHLLGSKPLQLLLWICFKQIIVRFLLGRQAERSRSLAHQQPKQGRIIIQVIKGKIQGV